MIVNRTHATVRGRVIAEYPIRSTNGGDVINFRVAANERQFDPATNAWVDKDTFYVTVSCWDALAKRVAAIPLRGQLIVAIGTLASRHYEKDGERRNYTELRAQHIAVDLGSVEAVRPVRAAGEGPGEGSDPGEPEAAADAEAGGEDPRAASATYRDVPGTREAGAAPAPAPVAERALVGAGAPVAADGAESGEEGEPPF